MKSLLDSKAFKKFSGGSMGQHAGLIKSMAEQAKAAGAADARIMLTFVGDDDTVDGEYVPFVAIGVRLAPQTNEQ